MSEFNTFPGRIVWGNPLKSQQKKDQQTKQVILKDGQPVLQWAWGTAFAKQQFDAEIRPWLEYEARSGYPQGFPSNFAWKFLDGDSVDKQGVPYANREGYAGHYVLTVSTEAFAPSVFKFNGRGYDELKDGVKTGDYIAMKLSVKVNVPKERTHTPGLYINPQGIELVGYGQEIFNGPDAQTMFGGRQYQLPPGASTTPVQSAGAAGTGMPGQQPPGAPPAQQYTPPAGQPQYQPPGVAAAPVYQQQQYQPPGAPPQQQYAPPQQQYAPPAGQPQYQPAPEFVQQAGQAPAYQPPQQQYAPPAGQPQYQPAPAPQQQQYAPQPGMPGQLPPGR